MEENADPNKPAPAPQTPEVEQLLKMLDLQAAGRRRDRRVATPAMFQGTSFRYGSLIAIVVFAFGAVAILEWMLSQIPRPVHSPAPSAPGLAATPDAKNGSAPLGSE